LLRKQTDKNDEADSVLAGKLYDELSMCRPLRATPKPDAVIEFDSRKYFDEAYNYQKVLILAVERKPIPYFLISLSDLSVTLKSNLGSLNATQLRAVLKSAVLRIFQDMDDNYNIVFQDPESKESQIHLAWELAKILKVGFAA
jgi:hypothetical protein